MSRWSLAIQRRWYTQPGWLWLLWPISWLYLGVSTFRRRRSRPWQAPVPVVVVGNIAVGGTGKTPVVAALVAYLREQGYRPGIVSRGYGGQQREPAAVGIDSDPAQVGDEPVLLAQLCRCPVWVGHERAAVVRALLDAHACDVIIADDGLQHHALGRDIEIVVVDGQRGLGNGCLLPVGPLREPPGRLNDVDWVLVNGGDWDWPGSQRFHLQPREWVRLEDGTHLPLAAGPKGRVHAVAGIGNPHRFFQTLRDLGLQPRMHAFADHYVYRSADLHFDEALPIVTTAKDAVKLRRLLAAGVAREERTRQSEALPQLWYLAVQAVLPEPFLRSLVERLNELSRRVVDS